MGGRRVKDFVSLCDLAPTFLEAAGLVPGKQMTGRSLVEILKSEREGRIEEGRSFVLTGLERHVQENPGRAIRTADFLYIRNRNTDGWESGEAKGGRKRFAFEERHWPNDGGAFSFNIDPSPTKQLMLDLRDSGDERAKGLLDLSFGQRAKEELFDIKKDPWQMRNVAGEAEYAEELKRMRERLETELSKLR